LSPSRQAGRRPIWVILLLIEINPLWLKVPTADEVSRNASSYLCEIFFFLFSTLLILLRMTRIVQIDWGSKHFDKIYLGRVVQAYDK